MTSSPHEKKILTGHNTKVNSLDRQNSVVVKNHVNSAVLKKLGVLQLKQNLKSQFEPHPRGTDSENCHCK